MSEYCDKGWKAQLADSRLSADALSRRFSLDPDVCTRVIDRYPVAVTPYYLGLIQSVDDPIGRQCLPDLLELQDSPDLLQDPLGEEAHHTVPGVVHRYRDRVVFLVASRCAVLCRFCTRKHRVGTQELAQASADWTAGLNYIAAHPEISDVLLSGGDPLLLSDDQLDHLLTALRAIPHVETVRIGSRVPVTLPQRVTASLVKVLKDAGPLYLNTHFNHPRELTPEASRACGLLADAGVVLGNQTVLLRGVNDDTETLRRLFKGLLRIRVRPYYLHQMDLVQGAGHFRTRIEEGLALMRELRGPVSGLAIPQYMVDLPGGLGKVPLTPDYLRKVGDVTQIEAPDGTLVTYPNNCGPGGTE